jgi:hypothetical protein
MVMDGRERRLVSELVTRYQLHPEMRDLYVEGESDKRFFCWFVLKLPLKSVAVYDIQSVEMTAQQVTALSVSEGGNKGRVVALAMILEKTLPPECDSVRCLVDKDFHEFGFPLPNCRYLIYTDFACMECYMLAENPLSKLCAVYLGRTFSPTEIESMMNVLKYVFFVRLSKQRLASTASWYDGFTTCCSAENGSLRLDETKYLAKVLNAAAGALKNADIEADLRRLQQIPLSDHLHAIHGHDAVNLIAWLATQKGVGKDIANTTPLQRAMFGCLEVTDLVRMPLFKGLLEWGAQAAEVGDK